MSNTTKKTRTSNAFAAMFLGDVSKLYSGIVSGKNVCAITDVDDINWIMVDRVRVTRIPGEGANVEAAFMDDSRVIIGNFVDVECAMEYAQTLSAEHRCPILDDTRRTARIEPRRRDTRRGDEGLEGVAA